MHAGGLGIWMDFVGCSCPSFQSHPETGSRFCTASVITICRDGERRMEIVLDLAATTTPGPSGHRKGVARQVRKDPQEEDLASIDTVLRIYGRLLSVGATLGKLSHGKPVDPHKGAHRLDPSSGICCPRPPAKPLRRLAERVSLLGRIPCAERNGYRQATRLHLSVDVTAAGEGCGSVQLWGSVSMFVVAANRPLAIVHKRGRKLR